MLGLGDSNYSKFQGAPRFLDDRVSTIGGKCFEPRTEADEATSLEIVIEPWLETIGGKLYNQILKVLKMTEEERQAMISASAEPEQGRSTVQQAAQSND